MNGIMEIRRQVRLSQWGAMVREREESGLSVKAYCRQVGIAAKTYYYRLCRLREAAVEQRKLFVPIHQIDMSRLSHHWYLLFHLHHKSLQSWYYI